RAGWRSSRTSSFTRSSARNGNVSSASSGSRRSLRPPSAPTWERQGARRGPPKATSSPRGAADSPSCKGQWEKITPCGRAGEAAVAAACEEHYKPLGPADVVPTAPVSVAVALADKIDTLVGFWAIGEKPTGSKDPYALRRAALGVIRIALSSKHDLLPRALFA